MPGQAPIHVKAPNAEEALAAAQRHIDQHGITGRPANPRRRPVHDERYPNAQIWVVDIEEET